MRLYRYVRSISTEKRVINLAILRLHGVGEVAISVTSEFDAPLRDHNHSNENDHCHCGQEYSGLRRFIDCIGTSILGVPIAEQLSAQYSAGAMQRTTPIR